MRFLPVPEGLPPRAGAHVNVVIETPSGTRNKYRFDAALDAFRLDDVLPAGRAFPFDLGFVPSTLGADGDPVDALLLLEEPVPVGCLVRTRLVGAVTLLQRKGGREMRNDRLIGLPVAADPFPAIGDIDELPAELIDRIEGFLCDYGAYRERPVRLLGRASASAALQMVTAGEAAWTGGGKMGGADDGR
jgi:inorganic pyrophosphatase